MSSAELAQQVDFHGLYNDHHGWLRCWLRKSTGCSETAADLAQDTFVKVMQKQREDSGFAIGYPRRYLRIVAGSLMVDHFRRRAVEKAYADALMLLPEPASISAEEREIILETLQQLDKMLDAMPARMRQAFLLSRLDGLTYQQIADQLGVSLRSVKRYMQQAFVQCLDLIL
ncbi:MAG: RNA polymerase sigma-70 factor (ECF subfamily) [Porticoccus sp.]|uniref:sigma-70 family RNA polymerase sigma factor n=1 Tax=Porticoccus sp. TaxID=2024853 RepID=UPI0039E25A78